jgi:alanine racemase
VSGPGPSWGPTATVDLDAIRRNARWLLGRCAPGTKLLAAVKADAYGHGAVPVAQALQRDGVGWFGVATADEAAQLRDGGIAGRLLLFGPVRGEALARALAAGADLTVCDEEDVAAAAAAADPDRPARVHLKVDTGMGRLGRPPERAVALAARIASVGTLRLEGVWTHLARADEPSQDATDRQLAAFQQALAALKAAGHRPALRHAANSAGTIAHPGAHFDLVRPGISLYGYPPGPDLAEVARDLEPALTLDAPIVFVKRVALGDAVSYGHRWHAPSATTIATVRIGYADGYPRALTNLGDAVVHGRRCRVVGTVCMDQTMIDVGDLEVAVGDRATLLGPDGPRADAMAERIGTIPYELLTRLSPRVHRRWTGGGQD